MSLLRLPTNILVQQLTSHLPRSDILTLSIVHPYLHRLFESLLINTLDSRLTSFHHFLQAFQHRPTISTIKSIILNTYDRRLSKSMTRICEKVGIGVTTLAITETDLGECDLMADWIEACPNLTTLTLHTSSTFCWNEINARKLEKAIFGLPHLRTLKMTLNLERQLFSEPFFNGTLTSLDITACHPNRRILNPRDDVKALATMIRQHRHLRYLALRIHFIQDHLHFLADSIEGLNELTQLRIHGSLLKWFRPFAGFTSRLKMLRIDASSLATTVEVEGFWGDHRWTCLEILEIENMYVTFPVFCDMILSVFGRNFPALKKVMLDNGFLEYEKLWDFEEGFFDGMEVKKGLSVCVRFRGRKSPFQGKSSLKLLKFLADAEELEFEEGQPNIFTESEMKEYLRCLQCTKTDMHGFLMRCSEGHQMFIEAMMVKRYLVLVKPYLVRLRDNELERLRKVLKTGRECEDVVVLWKGTLQSLREFLLVSEDVGMTMRTLVFKVLGEMGEPYFCNFLWELVRTQKRIRELRVVGRLRVDVDVIRFLEGMEKRGVSVLFEGVEGFVGVEFEVVLKWRRAFWEFWRYVDVQKKSLKGLKGSDGDKG